MKIPKLTVSEMIVKSRGRCARMSGDKRSDNPYRQDTMTRLHLLWLDAWEEENDRQKNAFYARAA